MYPEEHNGKGERKSKRVKREGKSKRVKKERDKEMKKILILIAWITSSVMMAQQKELCIVHTSDTHSCVEPLSPNNPNVEEADKGGYLRRAALLDRLREEHKDLLLLDCGDFSQGSVYYNLYKGEVEVKLMNEMGYDACTIGNHEFDNGLENMAKLFRLAKFPVVCCNYDFTGTPVEGLVKPYIVKECAGVRVGILGVSPKMDGLVAAANIGNTRYIDPAEAAQPVIDRLRGEEHCDVVICLSHLGKGTDPEMDPTFISRTRGIDVLLGGHTHTYQEVPDFIKDAEGIDVALDHQGKNGRFVGVMTLRVEGRE